LLRNALGFSGAVLAGYLIAQTILGRGRLNAGDSGEG